MPAFPYTLWGVGEGFKRFYFLASMRWHLVADRLAGTYLRLIRAGQQIALSLLAASALLWVGEERGWLKYSTGLKPPPMPVVKEPARPRITAPPPPSSVDRVVVEAPQRPASSAMLVVPEELPKEPEPEPPQPLAPVPEPAQAPPPPRRRLERKGNFVRVGSRAEPIIQEVAMQADRIKAKEEPYVFRALERPAPPPRQLQPAPAPLGSVAPILTQVQRPAEPMKLAVVSAPAAPSGPDPLAQRVPVRGGGAMPVAGVAPLRDEAAELRAARELEHARLKREWRRNLVRRAATGLAIASALLVFGFFGSGLYLGEKKIPRLDPDAPLQTRVDPSKGRPRTGFGDGSSLP